MQPHRAANSHRISVSIIEDLERRRLLSSVYLHDGYLSITGTHKQDFISIWGDRIGPILYVRIGHEHWQFPTAEVDWMRINGGAGDDRIGIDEKGGFQTLPTRIYGADGNDTIFGGSARDRIYGGNGDDVIYGGVSGDIIYGEAGNDSISGGTDPFGVHSNDIGVDHIWGGDGNDTLAGSRGNDSINGDAGDDSINGDDGDDSLGGDDGQDTLSGGLGIDSIFGGPGIDLFSTDDDPSEDEDKELGEL